MQIMNYIIVNVTLPCTIYLVCVLFNIEAACVCIASITSRGFPPSGQYVQTQSEISCRLSGSMCCYSGDFMKTSKTMSYLKVHINKSYI